MPRTDRNQPQDGAGGSSRSSGRSAIDALTAAALLLPGINGSLALAEPKNDVAVQTSHFRESRNGIAGAPVAMRPIAVDTIVVRSNVEISRSDALALTCWQDTWSGATPITTAPVGAMGNRPLLGGGTGRPITVGASPMINGRVMLDGSGRPLDVDPVTGKAVAGKGVVHTMSSASPEARQQLDLKLSRRLAAGTLSLGGGVSAERDYHSRFVNLGGGLDLNQRQTTLTLGLSHTRSRIDATLDHDALPYITKSAYRDRIEARAGQQVLRGHREDWAGSLGLTQVLGPSALLEAHLAYNHSAGYLANPYKLTSVIFSPDLPGLGQAASGPVSGDLQALLEQRPARRRQRAAGGKLIVHVSPYDAALHLGYEHSRDDWGIAAHRLEAEWFQPVGQGWLVAPRVRYYTQSAARFYVDYLVSRQAYRQVSIGADGTPVIATFDPALLPPTFSSDQRLSAFGSLAFGLGLSKPLARGVSLELGLERARHSAALKAGGPGSGGFADFGYVTANAALRFELDSRADGGSGNAATRSTGHDDHGHSAAPRPGPAIPSGVQFAHLMGRPGEAMIAYRLQATRLGGPMRKGSNLVDEAALATQACFARPCLTLPTAMGMRMQMLEMMVGVSDTLTLMVMPQYTNMAMDTRLIMGAVALDEPVHVGRHESMGLGDTQFHALLELQASQRGRWVLGLGLSAPTGATDLRHRRSHQQDGQRLDYDMQPGSGTWDLMPTLTYLGRVDRLSWGAQLAGTLRMQTSNSSGYRLGHRWQGSGWIVWQAGSRVQASLRASSLAQGRVRLSAAGTETGWSPPDFAGNQGGRWREAGLGMTIDGWPGLASALGIEWVVPTKATVNGHQLARRSGLTLQWSQHF